MSNRFLAKVLLELLHFACEHDKDQERLALYDTWKPRLEALARERASDETMNHYRELKQRNDGE